VYFLGLSFRIHLKHYHQELKKSLTLQYWNGSKDKDKDTEELEELAIYKEEEEEDFWIYNIDERHTNKSWK
jgi:hypothetical protein